MAAARPGDDAASPAGGDADVEALGRDPVEVLVEEYFEKRRRGDASDAAEFARRVPGREAQFRELVAALGVLESAAAAAKAAAAASAGGAPPERLGRFRLLRRIGRGGMGTVYEALDDELGRRVALKVLSGHATLDERELARFRREAQSAARLHHPHIVPVYGVGHEEGPGGAHWIAMQLIEGTSLEKLVQATGAGDGGRRMDPKDVARHGLALADALACAHVEGILHRDVKPSNVLLDQSGTVWITDFGLATSEGAAAITRTGETVGTPRYMAPEAFSGWADPRTDVWGVGVTLYELLAGRPAFDGASRAQLLKQIGESEPTPLRSLDPSLPRDLATIVHKCLQKEPGLRYASARELADDLRRFQDGAPIHARPPTPVDRVARLVRRHRVAALATGVALLALVALLGAWGETLRRKNDRLAQEIARSEENLAVASDAIERVLDEATADVVFRAPALDPLRRRVLEAALAFELRLLANQEQSASKHIDVAMAHLRVGQIDWELRRLDESRAHYEAAARALRSLVGTSDRADGGDESAAMQLAAALAGIACVARDRGELESAETSLRDGLAVLERSIGGEPRNVDEAHHLLFVTTLLADLLSGALRAREGAALLNATLPRVTPWLDRDDAKAPASRVLRDALVQLAEAEHQAGDAMAAIATVRRALVVSQRLVAIDDPDVRHVEFDAARRSWLGRLLHDAGHPQEAGPLLAGARADLDALAGRWPMVPEFRRDLADALAREAAAAPVSEPRAAIEARLVRAIGLADGGLAERPGDPSFALAALNARNSLTTLRHDAGDLDGAYLVALEATQLIESRSAALATWPASPLEEAAAAWYDRSIVERDLGRSDDSRASLAKASELARRLVEGGGATPSARSLRLRIGVQAGSLSAAQGAIGDALSAWAAVEADARRILADAELAGAAQARDATLADVAALLVQALNLDANVRARNADPHGDPAATADHAGAASRLAEAIALGDSLVVAWPDRADYAAALGMAHGDAGLLAYFQSVPPRARAEYRLALPLLQRAIERDPRQEGWRRALAIVMDGLAGALQAPADAEDAEALASLLATVTAAVDAASGDPGVQIEAARVFARAATVKHGLLATRLGAPARDPWADAAMARLLAASAAGAAGFVDPARMDRDVAFDSLRTREDFRRWLADLKAASR